jgi:hypothetical protein
MTLFTIKGPPPRLDGKRAYQGRAQLSDADRRILQLGRLHGIRVLHEGGETIFVSGRARLRRQSVLRLLQLGYLIAANDGLFGTDSAQTILVNITPPRLTPRAA